MYLTHSDREQTPYSDILHILVRDKVEPSRRIIRRIRLHRLPTLQRSILHNPSTGHTRRTPIQSVGPAQNGEVGQADLIRVPVDNGWQAKVARIDRIMANLQFKVSTIIQLIPLQFAIGADEPSAGIVGCCNGDVVASGAWTRHGSTSKFHSNGAFAGSGVVGLVVEPDKIADPVCVRVAGDDDIIANVVGVEGVECAVAVGLVAVPGVIVERVDVAVCE